MSSLAHLKCSHVSSIGPVGPKSRAHVGKTNGWCRSCRVCLGFVDMNVAILRSNLGPVSLQVGQRQEPAGAPGDNITSLVMKGRKDRGDPLGEKEQRCFQYGKSLGGRRDR